MKKEQILHDLLTEDKIRLGFVSIPTKMTTVRMLDVLFENFIPVAAEVDFEDKKIIYLGISDHFELSTYFYDAVRPPEYILQLREKKGQITFDKFLLVKEGGGSM